MKILAIDTSTKFLCLGIYDDGRVCEYTLETGRQLSSLLAVTVNRVLENLGWQAKDLDYLACGTGPGSFTGMRTGISFVKGMSWALKKPVIAVSSLDILAAGVNTDKHIVPMIDAKRGLIYCAFYKRKNNKLTRISPYMLLGQEELLEKVKKDAIILGDALDLYRRNILVNPKSLNLLEKDYWYPKPHNIIQLALEKIKNKQLNTAFDIKPIYLYPKECQIKK